MENKVSYRKLMTVESKLKVLLDEIGRMRRDVQIQEVQGLDESIDLAEVLATMENYIKQNEDIQKLLANQKNFLLKQGRSILVGLVSYECLAASVMETQLRKRMASDHQQHLINAVLDFTQGKLFQIEGISYYFSDKLTNVQIQLVGEIAQWRD